MKIAWITDVYSEGAVLVVKLIMLGSILAHDELNVYGILPLFQTFFEEYPCNN